MNFLSSLTPAIGSTGSAAETMLYERIFGRVQVAAEWSETLTSAAKHATLVHLMRSGTLLDVLCVNHLCRRAGLPVIRFVSKRGDDTMTQTLLGTQLASSHPLDDERSLQEVVMAADSALLFLRTPSLSPARPAEVDLLLALVRAQRQSSRPILLIPQTLVWGKLPSHKRPTLGDLLFGPAEEPGRLRVLANLALNPHNALLRAGPPFDLREFVQAHPALTDDALAEKIRYAMLRRVERERTIVLGPSTKTPERIRDEILRSPRLRPPLQSAARASQRTVDEVRAQAAKDLDRLIAAPSATLLGMMNRALDLVWNQLYDGLVVDEEGMARVRDASRRGTLVLFPSHKSHIDYVVLSDVFYARGLSPPIVAAGDNLNFWPLGPALRHAGAFFIHRALAGQKLYSALLAAYIRRLLLEGFTLEVFLEGGRSRTGKLLQPKLGMLSMIVDAAIAMNGHPVYFVPISIAYERVIEERAFVHELAGFEKESEDIGALLQAPKVFRSRYGRLFLQVGEILSFQDLITEVKANSRGSDGSLSPKARRTLIHNIATRTAYEINRVTVVTPSALTATALLCHRRRGLTKPALVDLSRALMHALARRGASMAAPLTKPTSPQLAASISEALQLLVDAKLVSRQRTGPETVYRVPSTQRIAVEYYKNSILHFFTPSALLAVVLLSQHGKPMARGALVADSTALAERLAYELPRAEWQGDPWNATIETMVSAGELAERDGAIRVATGAQAVPLERYAWMIRGSLESLRIALRGIHPLNARPVALKTWLKDTLALGERMYLAGEIEVREAVSRDRLENALHALHEAGLVRLQSEQSVAAGKEHSTERLAAEDALLTRYLP